MTLVSYGEKITVRNGRGRVLPKRALTDVLMGEDFPVVWACSEKEWERAAAEGRQPEGVPWPADDVEPVGSE